MALKHSFGLLLIFCILLSCKKESDESLYVESESYLYSAIMDDTTSSDRTMTITIIHSGDNSCSQLSRFEASLIQDTINYKIYQKYPDESHCTNQIIQISSTVYLTLIDKGWRYIKFYNAKDDYFVDSVFVK